MKNANMAVIFAKVAGEQPKEIIRVKADPAHFMRIADDYFDNNTVEYVAVFSSRILSRLDNPSRQDMENLCMYMIHC